MVEEASGAVVMVGGFSRESDYDDILRLSHANGTWEELPQKLSHQREHHVAFLVPDYYANCTSSS